MSKQNPGGGSSAPSEDQDELTDTDDTKDESAGPDEETESADESAGEGETSSDESGSDDESGREDSGTGEAEGTALTERLERIEKALLHEKGEESEAEVSADSFLLPEPTEQQAAVLEKNFGLNRQQAVGVTRMVNAVAKKIFDHFDGKMGDVSRVNVLRSMSADAKFKDIMSYEDGINKALSKFAPNARSNKSLIEMAYYAEKGKGSPKAIRKAASGAETNRRIAVNQRPSSPGANKGTKVKEKPLSAQQESARKAAGMSTEEYRKYQRKSPTFKAA